VARTTPNLSIKVCTQGIKVLFQTTVHAFRDSRGMLPLYDPMWLQLMTLITTRREMSRLGIWLFHELNSFEFIKNLIISCACDVVVIIKGDLTLWYKVV